MHIQQNQAQRITIKKHADFHKEDPATERLCDLLRLSPEVLHAFLGLLGGSKLPWTKTAKQLNIRSQVPVPCGRMDMVIDDGKHAAIVECKVMDRQKVYQLEKYYKYWSLAYQVPPQIFWLTRRQDDVLWGSEKYLAGQITWNQLHDHLKALLPTLSQATQKAVTQFLWYLQENGILLGDGQSTSIKRRPKGLSHERAFGILEAIAAHFEGCQHKIDEENELPYRLLIGCKRWCGEFNDNLVKKVRVFLEPDSTTDAGFFLWPRICLYHWEEYLGRGRDEATKQAYLQERFQQWTDTCSNVGLLIVRNGPGKTRRAYNQPMAAPFRFDASIRVLLAEEPQDRARASSAGVEDDLVAIRVGIEGAQRLMDVVDRLQR